MGDAAAGGIDTAGGLAVRWDTQRTPDLVTWGHAEGYSFAWRDQFADFVESWARQEALDGLVLVGDSHKTLAGMAMAAARPNLPAVIVTTGAAAWIYRPAAAGSRQKKALPDAYELLSARVVRKEKADGRGRRTAFQACRLAQDNHAAHASIWRWRRLGVCLPGMATAAGASRRGATNWRWRPGKRVMALAQSGHAFRSVLTPNAFSNAIRVSAALGGSTDVAVHLMALAHEAGVTLVVGYVRSHRPRNAAGLPLGRRNGKAPHRLDDLDRAGGVWAVMHTLKAAAPAATTLSGKGASELAKGART